MDFSANLWISLKGFAGCNICQSVLFPEALFECLFPLRFKELHGVSDHPKKVLAIQCVNEADQCTNPKDMIFILMPNDNLVDLGTFDSLMSSGRDITNSRIPALRRQGQLLE